jgi:hypothetical protein
MVEQLWVVEHSKVVEESFELPELGAAAGMWELAEPVSWAYSEVALP